MATSSPSDQASFSVWIDERRVARGRTYRLRWIEDGRKRSKGCGRDRKLARDLLTQKLEELRGRARGECPRKLLSDLREELNVWMAGKASATLRKTRGSIQAVIDACGDRPLLTVGRELAMKFRAARLGAGTAAATVNKDLRHLKSALSYAVDARWIRANPLLRWKAMFVREPERTIRVVTPAEFQKLIKTCRERFGHHPGLPCLMTLSYLQGLRRRELAQLRWTSVNLEGGPAGGYLLVRNVFAGGEEEASEDELTKSRRIRTVPLRAAAATALAEHLAAAQKTIVDGNVQPSSPYVFCWPDDGRPYDPDWLSHGFGEIVQAAKIRPCTLHDLRRSFSTNLQLAGVDRHLVKDLGGWSSVTVVEKHYTGQIDPALRAAMDKADAASGGPGPEKKRRRKA